MIRTRKLLRLSCRAGGSVSPYATERSRHQERPPGMPHLSRRDCNGSRSYSAEIACRSLMLGRVFDGRAARIGEARRNRQPRRVSDDDQLRHAPTVPDFMDIYSAGRNQRQRLHLSPNAQRFHLGPLSSTRSGRVRLGQASCPYRRPGEGFEPCFSPIAFALGKLLAFRRVGTGSRRSLQVVAKRFLLLGLKRSGNLCARRASTKAAAR
jgi:hypothetical protein